MARHLDSTTWDETADLQKFSSGQELLDKWHQEAQAAMGAINAGAAQVWKDAADTVVYVVLTIEADDAAQAHANVLTIFGRIRISKPLFAPIQRYAQ